MSAIPDISKFKLSRSMSPFCPRTTLLLFLLRFWSNFLAFSTTPLVVWKHKKYLLNLNLVWEIEQHCLYYIGKPLLCCVQFSYLKVKAMDGIYPPSPFCCQHSTCLWCLPLFFLPTFSNHKKLGLPPLVRLLLKMELPKKARSCSLGCSQTRESLFKIIFC